MIKYAFRTLDMDQTGRINFRMWKTAVREFGMEYTDEEIMGAIEEADRDNDGEINEAEFIEFMKAAGFDHNLKLSDD